MTRWGEKTQHLRSQKLDEHLCPHFNPQHGGKSENTNTESHGKLRKTESEVRPANPLPFSGGQRPQLDCNDIEGSHEYGGWPKSFCAHYNRTWKSVAAPKATASVCVCSGETSNFMTETIHWHPPSFQHVWFQQKHICYRGQFWYYVSYGSKRVGLRLALTESSLCVKAELFQSWQSCWQ